MEIFGDCAKSAPGKRKLAYLFVVWGKKSILVSTSQNQLSLTFNEQTVKIKLTPGFETVNGNAHEYTFLFPLQF